MNDARDYLATRKAMDIVGISKKEQVFKSSNWIISYFILCNNLAVTYHLFQDAIFRVVASILHLGNLEFAKGEEIDSSIIKDDKSKFHLQMTAELLMCVFISVTIRLCICGWVFRIACIMNFMSTFSGVIYILLKMHYLSV